MNDVAFTTQDVAGIAALAKIPVTKDEESALADGFNIVIAVVDKLMSIDTSSIPQVFHVTGLENIFREDSVEDERMLTQEEALANAKWTYNGFFVVDQILINE